MWPRLRPDEEPRVWFARLKEDYLQSLFISGQRKIPIKSKRLERESNETYPFILPPAFQRMLFMDQIAAHDRTRPPSERDILNCYLTSLFNAWLDNQNLYGDDKRWVVAFAPRLAWGKGGDRFFETYPDGRVISILRDPWSWYTSARGRERAEGGLGMDRLLERWKQSVREMLAGKERYGSRLSVVRFEDLVSDTEQTMRALVGYLGIDFDPQLCVPTFNRYPVGANSSYAVRQPGVLTDPLTRHRELLPDEDRALIGDECQELYEQALALVGFGGIEPPTDGHGPAETQAVTASAADGPSDAQTN